MKVAENFGTARIKSGMEVFMDERVQKQFGPEPLDILKRLFASG